MPVTPYDTQANAKNSGDACLTTLLPLTTSGDAGSILASSQEDE